jgi:hypothetical protein
MMTMWIHNSVVRTANAALEPAVTRRMCVE